LFAWSSEQNGGDGEKFPGNAREQRYLSPRDPPAWGGPTLQLLRKPLDGAHLLRSIRKTRERYA